MSATVCKGMTAGMWSIGDVCFVAGEGDDVFVVEEVGEHGAYLFGHGREGFTKMHRPTTAQLQKTLAAMTARLALLQVQALQVSLAILKATP